MSETDTRTAAKEKPMTDHDEWTECKDALPSEGETVVTKIDNAQGCRNEQSLKRRGRLWFFPDGSMYVYYTPTHWHAIDTVGAGI